MTNTKEQIKENIIEKNTDPLASVPLVSLTKSAGQYIQKILENSTDAKGIRLGVKNSGCSGFGYVVDCAKEITANDIVYESEGVCVIIDRESLPFLNDMQIDCVTEGLNQVLKFENPNAKHTCGCGESFSVDD